MILGDARLFFLPFGGNEVASLPTAFSSYSNKKGFCISLSIFLKVKMFFLKNMDVKAFFIQHLNNIF